MANFGVPAVELVRGEGAVVVDADGKQYLDLLGGIAVNSLGHAHPAVVAAVTAQISTLGHVSNFFTHPTVLDLAEQLLRLVGAEQDGRALFCNSGAEANEAAFKMARLTGRPRIIATHGGFHGRTMGALALTGQPGKRAPFEPMPAGVEFVPYGDVDALRAVLDSDVAAVFLEPIQGEAGVIPAPDGYLAAARQLTTEHGALLVLDEVQTGIGRTGSWFAHQRAGIRPDIVTLAKGLGGGLPIGAVLASAPPPRCCRRASTDRPSPGTPSARPPRSRCCRPSSPTDCSTMPTPWASTSPVPSRISVIRWCTPSGAPACCWASCCGRRSPRRPPPRRWRPGSSSTRRLRTSCDWRRRWC